MSTNSPTAQKVLDYLAQHDKAAVSRLVDWLRIPSISTDPAKRGETRRAAQWCVEQLKEVGFGNARLVETGTVGKDGLGDGHPIVMASVDGAATYKGPRVLFYGHYDVQPVDPENLWESPPFAPVIKPADKGYSGATGGDIPGERIIARGAVDDKGQVMTFIEACRAWKHVDGHPTGGVPYTLVIEGEEECGSGNLGPFVRAHKQELSACKVCLISDTGMVGRGQPAITYGVRGLAYTQITLHASNQDLHSGLWGGRCPNPNTELARVIAQLHDKDRRVTIPGFYDDVRPIASDERAAWQRLAKDTGLSAKSTLAKIGLGEAADIGEAGYSFMEREWGRPTAEVNGMWGGYTGAGAKTVIPAHASAKVSFRLVANQDPQKIVKLFFAWLNERTPPGCRWELEDMHGGLGVTTPTDSAELRMAVRAMERASGRAPYLIKSGGSIPVAGLLKQELAIDTIFMGFGLDDDRVHSPNEKFELDCFRLGMKSHALLVEELRGAR